MFFEKYQISTFSVCIKDDRIHSNVSTQEKGLKPGPAERFDISFQLCKKFSSFVPKFKCIHFQSFPSDNTGRLSETNSIQKSYH